MVQKLNTLAETASQTACPYVHIGLMPTYAGNGDCFATEVGTDLITGDVQGEIIEIVGSVLDGTGWALRDVLIESWQSDANGAFPGQAGADPNFTGFCRFAADADTGEFTLRTVKPGAYSGSNGAQSAPHISLWIVSRGVNIGLNTRIYFSDCDNSDDPVLRRIEQAHRVNTLVAQKSGDGRYRFDIRLQGPGETVFLDV